MDATQTLAAALIDARRSRRLLPAAEADRLAAEAGHDGALAVQALVIDALGPVGAWKASPAVAGEGMFSPIPAEMVRPSGAAFGTDELFHCGVEIEIAFRFDATPPAPGVAEFEAELRKVVTIVPVLEILDGRAEAFAARPQLTKLADFLVNGGLVVGTPEGTAVDLSRPAVRLVIGGQAVVEGPAEVPGGDAFATLANFVRTVGGHCGGLRAGHIVTTGALGGMHPVAPGDSIEGTIAGLGSVAATFG